MTDIVERLRGFADLFEAQHAPGNLVLHMRAGADEIERKSAEIDSLLTVLADTRTENMRLRAALERAADFFFDVGMTEEWAEARAALTAQPAAPGGE